MQRAPKIIDFLEVHLNVHCRCILQSSFGQHLICMFNNCITVCPGKIKKEKTVYLINIYLHYQDIWHRSSHPRKLTSVACCALAQQCLFRWMFPPIWRAYPGDLTRKFNRGRQRVAPHGTTQAYLVTLQKLHTRHYLCTLCYWTNMFTFFKRWLSIQFTHTHVGMTVIRVTPT